MTNSNVALWSVQPSKLKECRAWMKRCGHPYKVVLGKYKGQHEFSFCTYHDVLEQALLMGFLVGQESYIIMRPAVGGSYATLYGLSDEWFPSITRIKSGSVLTSTRLNDLDEDYTYSPDRREYITIQWFH